MTSDAKYPETTTDWILLCNNAQARFEEACKKIKNAQDIKNARDMEKLKIERDVLHVAAVPILSDEIDRLKAENATLLDIINSMSPGKEKPYLCGSCSSDNHLNCSGWCFCGCDENKSSTSE